MERRSAEQNEMITVLCIGMADLQEYDEFDLSRPIEPKMDTKWTGYVWGK